MVASDCSTFPVNAVGNVDYWDQLFWPMHWTVLHIAETTTFLAHPVDIYWLFILSIEGGILQKKWHFLYRTGTYNYR